MIVKYKSIFIVQSNIYAYNTSLQHQFTMSQFNETENEVIYLGDHRQFYSYRGELYTGTFPVEWAKNHILGTGPTECANCAYFGSWNGVFIGYCSNCALYDYAGLRGRGFIDCGYEFKDECVLEFESIFETYLKDVNLDDIGDKDILDSAAMMQEPELISEEDDDFEELEELEELEENDDLEDCLEFGYGSNYNGGYDSY